MAEDRTKPTQLASPKAWERLGTAVAEGSSAWLFRASGTELVKLAKPNHAETLTNEARHALFTRCESLPELLGFGQLPEAAAPRHVTPDAAGVYSVWRYLPGADAAECALHEAALLKILRDVSRALATLHARGLCHGDVKPDNLRWDTESQRAWLLDLGLVAPLSTRIPRGATPRYLDPNLVEGRSSSGRDRDLYALGLTLLELALPAARSHRAPAGLAAELPRSGREAQALASVIDSLLAPRSQHRPPARWLWREACHLLGEPDPALTPDPFRVESSYLWVRRAELLGAAHPDTRIDLEGAPREWVERCLELAVPLAPQCCESPAEARHVGPLSPRGRRAWLVELVGAEAANLRIPDVSEAELAARVLDHCQSFPAIMLGERELLRADSPERVPRSLQTLGLALSREPSLACLFAGVELVHEGDAEPELRVALASALRRRGEFATALSILNTEADLDSRAEHAETLRRMGDSAGASAMARATLKQLLSSPPDQDRIADRLRGTLARASLELGDVDAAEAALRFDPPGINALEARVLLRLRKAALGQAPLQPVETDLELAEVLAHGDEERARAQGLRGFFEHQRGNVERALRAFERAVEHSRRAGAPTEEATYLTGVAATATDCGKLGQAIQAAERASLMFGHFCELSRAARAQLNLGAALLATGAYAPAADAFDSAIDLATRSGDHGCQRAATLSSIELAVCRADSNPEQLPALAARVAEVNQRFVDASPAERLLLGALRLQADQVHRAHAASLPDGQVTASELPELEQLARDTTLPVSSRLEWWKARALMALDGETGRFGRPDAVLRELVALAAEPAPLISRGPALAAGAALAASLRSGDFARRLGRAAEHAASQLRQEVPEEYRPLTDELPWVKRLTSLFDLELAGHDVLAGAQLLKLEQLVRGLGVRGNLRALLNQVLDALVLWTGVERGLLLLKAPGNKLRVRAARNLSREDLSAHQRQLSMTLATRAVSAREPVVAVDALGELPELTESVHALNLRSVLAVPLVARGEVLGVVYLDDRDRRGAFGETELAWVRLLSSVASIAIAEARDQLLLRRAARQAERSKRRLEATLQDERRELVLAKRQLDSRPHPEIVGESPQMVELLRLIDKVAETSLPVLVYGESGTGKELVARAVHRASDRSKRGFVAENCAAVPESLLESTLFGHVKGAFTGADKNRVGLFELADGGSLFLDEIGEMSLAMQAKLLRVLERGEIRPVGAATTRRVDVRIIAATHRNLPELVKQGNFREDLFYRLDGFSLQVPALRERPGDVRLLCHHFLAQMAETAPKLSAAALRVLEDYSWPGNVRQLQNELRRATVLCDGSLRPEHLSPELRREAREAEAGLDLKRALELLERRLVGEALERTSGNQTRAAKLLGVSRFGLQKMIKRLEIDATGS